MHFVSHQEKLSLCLLIVHFSLLTKGLLLVAWKSRSFQILASSFHPLLSLLEVYVRIRAKLDPP